MIICHQHRFIFFRLPKTASTSLAIALSGFCGPEDTITGISKPDEELRRKLGYPGPQNYLRPLWGYRLKDLLSILLHRRRPDYKHPRAAAVRRFVGAQTWASYFTFCVERNPFDRAISSYYFEQRLRPLPEINAYICSRADGQLSNWRRYTDADKIIVSHVARFENLAAELAQIGARLGLPEIVLPRTKTGYRTDRRPYSEVLTSASRRHIEKACGNEIAHFGYEWTDAPT